MDVIHFTRGATDPLYAYDSQGVNFIPLADGAGDTHIGCVHVKPGGIVEAPSLTHAAAILVVHGRVQITHPRPFISAQVHAGMGCVFDANEPYTLRSDTGAIFLIVEADRWQAHERGISSLERIAGATWPSDAALNAL